MPSALIIVDLEGCCEVIERDPKEHLGSNAQELIDVYRRICTEEILAGIDGLSSAGFNKIHVYEGHPQAVNKQYLPDHIKFSSAINENTFLNVSQKHWDCVVLIGSHAAEGTPNATLSHTMSDRNPQIWSVNGVQVGETGIQVLMLSMKKSPVFMVTGGLCLANELGYWCPQALHVIVKLDEGWNCAKSLDRSVALRKIREAASSLKARSFQKLNVSSPYTIELSFCGGSLWRVFFRIAWLLKRLFIKKPKHAKFNFLKGSISVTGDDPRILVNSLLGKQFSFEEKNS